MNIFGNEEEEPQTEDTKVISNSLGIDLGTLNTVIAKPSGDKFDLYQIPSVVAVKKDDPAEVLAVGEEAKTSDGSSFLTATTEGIWYKSNLSPEGFAITVFKVPKSIPKLLLITLVSSVCGSSSSFPKIFMINPPLQYL